MGASAEGVAGIEQSLTDLSRRTAASSGRPVVRVKTVNLVVCGSEPIEADTLDALEALEVIHPSRTLILSPGVHVDAPRVRARVATECHPTEERILCYERIFIETSDRAADHLIGVVRPLLVSHIPTCLWWVGDPGFSDDTFRQLARITDRVIVDSQRFTRIETDLKDLLDLVSSCATVVIDLNWQRLTPWREIVAQCFAGDAGAIHLNALTSVSMHSGAHPMQGLLGLGWLASRLDWRVGQGSVLGRPVDGHRSPEVALRLETGQGSDGDLDLIALTTSVAGQEGHIEVARNQEQMVTRMRGAGLPDLCRTTRCQWPSNSELLHVALATQDSDDIFAKSVEAASRIAPMTYVQERISAVPSLTQPEAS